MGSSPSQGDIFFQKSDLNWPFFTHSNTLESHIILRGQRSRKPQNSKVCARNEGNRDRDLFMYT